MNKLLHKAIPRLKRSLPAILTFVGAVGVVATTVMAVKATPKALRLIEKAKEEKGEDLTKLETVKASATAYIPAAVVGASAIACVFGANILNKRRQAAITSAYMLLDNAYKEYRRKSKKLFGEDADNRIKDEVIKELHSSPSSSGMGDEDFAPDILNGGEKRLFYEEYYGRFFERTMSEVLQAEYCLNRNFALRGFTDLAEFYDFLHLPDDPRHFGNVLGWSLGAGEMFYGYSWIDFKHRVITTDDGLEIVCIEYPFAPTADFIDVDYDET